MTSLPTPSEIIKKIQDFPDYNQNNIERCVAGILGDGKYRDGRKLLYNLIGEYTTSIVGSSTQGKEPALARLVCAFNDIDLHEERHKYVDILIKIQEGVDPCSLICKSNGSKH